MSMLSLMGQVMNVFESPTGKNKETGEAFGGKPRVQILCKNTLPNEETRLDLVNLTVEDEKLYKSFVGKWIRVPVGAFVNGGVVAFYALKNESPEPVQAAARA